MTKDGRAVPVVDELAAIPLSLWAAEKGYVEAEPQPAGALTALEGSANPSEGSAPQFVSTVRW